MHIVCFLYIQYYLKINFDLLFLSVYGFAEMSSTIKMKVFNFSLMLAI